MIKVKSIKEEIKSRTDARLKNVYSAIANWKCAKGKMHLNFTKIHDAPCSPQMIAEADCDGDKDKCGDACHAKSK